MADHNVIRLLRIVARGGADLKVLNVNSGGFCFQSLIALRGVAGKFEVEGSAGVLSGLHWVSWYSQAAFWV